MAKIKDYDKLKQIIEKFSINGLIEDISPINNGIINTTYVATLNDGSKYLLQKINVNIFKEPYRLMKNIENVTDFIKHNDSETRDSLTVIKTKEGAPLYVDKDEFSHKEYYRVYNYITDAISYDKVESCDVAYKAGKAFGHFQKVLRNYPMELLEETIENFHNTQKRYSDFLDSYKKDAVGRKEKAYFEICEIMSRDDVCGIIVDLLNKKKIPYRVTHNDTKVNNVLVDKETKEPVAVIDLDTVMPGSGLYDYGDGIRSAASTALEDEKDLTKVSIDIEKFKSYTDGFLSEMAPYLKNQEVLNMVNSIRIITLELAMRFLTDYLNGDTYFKTEYEDHNLDRARNQIKLVKDIEEKMSEMEEYINSCYKKHKGLSIRKKNS